MSAESSPPKYLFLAGSTRQDSYNKRLAQFGATLAQENNLNADFLDLKDFSIPLYNGDDEAQWGIPDDVQRLHDAMLEYNGIFIASPEYNSSLSPLLKNTIDWLSRIKLEGKPPAYLFKSRVFALGAASTGNFGGVRGLLHLRQVLASALGALVIGEQILVPRVAEAFDDEGRLKDQASCNLLQSVISRLDDVARG